MFQPVNSFSQIRKQKSYEQEISRILYQIIKRENFPSCSISYSVLSKKGESLKIYLNFSQPQKEVELLEILNKQYVKWIKKELAHQKKFAYIPQIKFFWDEKLVEINKLEKIIY